MQARCRKIAIAAALGCGLAATSCTPSGDTVIRCGSRRATVADVLEEARRPSYDALREDPDRLIDIVVRNLAVRLMLAAEPATDEEKATIAQLDRAQAQNACVELGMKRLLASKGDLESEARTRFEADPKAYFLPESFRLQMIFIPEDHPDGATLAGRILREVDNDPDRFADLARRYSDSETAAGGGYTQPMPGSAVHPDLRRAINEHHATKRPFEVHTDRGWTLLRVLEFWPPVEGTYDQVAATVRKKVGSQMIDEVRREVSAEVSRDHVITIDQGLFRKPAVPADAPVITIDGTPFTAAEVDPGMNAGDTVPGPVLRAATLKFRSRQESILHLGCTDVTPTDVDDNRLAALRLGSRLQELVDTTMTADLEQYFSIHRDAFRSQAEFTYDLWVFPYGARDRYRDLQRYRDLIDQVRQGADANPDEAGRRGVEYYPALALDETHVAAYEPSLLATLTALADGETSEVIRSTRVGAFLLVRRHALTEGRPMTLEDPAERRVVIVRFIADNRETVMGALAERALAACSVDQTLVRRAVDIAPADRSPSP